MPTFQSIPLHPILKQRLLEPPNADGVSITTPQALLSRTPQALADQLMIHNATNDNHNPTTSAAILTQMDTLRSQVAHAMMAKTKTGMHRLQQQQFYDDRNHNNEYYHATRPLILGATVNAMQALRQEQEQKGQILSISTGCRALDALVSLPPDYSNSNSNISAVEGFPRGHVLCFSGPSGSGKTQLSLQLAVQASSLFQQESSSCRVRYCYSTAGQSGRALAQRCAQLIQNQLSSSSSLEKQVLKNIEFQPVRTTTRLVTVLASLEEKLLLNSNTSPTVYQHPFMLVVDSLSNLEVVQDEHQVARIGRWLKRLARQYSIWVVLVVSGKNGTTNGDFQIACHPNNQNAVVATLLQHPTRPDQPSITLLHTPSGMTTRSTPEAQS
jgi:KaiC/GvpD/RAD55 family RecA-like ATPase